MKIPKNPESFPKIPGSKNWKIPSRKIPGLKFLIPLGPAQDYFYSINATQDHAIPCST